MPFDALAIHYLTEEMKNHLVNSRIGKIFQPEKERVIIEAFHPFPRRELKLLLSVHPRFYRTHLLTAKTVNPAQPPAFCMLLRKYLQGGRIIDLEQPEWERIIIFRVEVYQPEIGLTTFSLVFEAMGPSSNLILLDQQETIIDALKRLPERPGRQRVLMPGNAYLPPPAPARYHPGNLTLAAWERMIQFSPPATKIATVLSRELFGLSPSLIQEILLQADVAPSTTVNTIGAEAVQRLYTTLTALEEIKREEIPPACLYLNDAGDPVDFFPYQPVHLPADQLQPVADLSSAIEASLHRLEEEAQFQQQAGRLIKVLNKAKTRARKKLTKQQRELEQAEDADTFRLFGELITVHLGGIKRGQKELWAENYYRDGEQVLIPLNPALDPVENSQFYYKKYSKAKKGQAKIRKHLQETEMELAYYESLETSLQQATSSAELAGIELEMFEAGLISGKKRPQRGTRKPSPERPTVFKAEGWEILVGRNNKQNDQLTMKLASPGDLWLHTQKIPGSHVLIRSQGRTVPPEVLLAAANLAVYFSKARGSSKVPVDYTEKRHVRKPAGAPPGYVLYERFETVIIDPDELLLRKLGIK
ncbi:MAG: fibronectin-binding domain-containing protein [Firmicutes bacterium]|nr:fibronectin-binding domain-containing protein [Bacillota bacterium]